MEEVAGAWKLHMGFEDLLAVSRKGNYSWAAVKKRERCIYSDRCGGRHVICSLT